MTVNATMALLNDLPSVQGHQSSFEVLPLETLADIIEQSVDCTKIGVDGTIRYMTKRAAQSFGLVDAEKRTGTPWSEMWPIEHRPAVEGARMRASMGETSSFRARRPCADGSIAWFEGSMFPVIAPDGSIRGIAIVTRDVTPMETVRDALDTKTAEMRHRLRNTYSMIGSLVTSFSRGTPERESFAEEMMERLSALGAAQALLVNSRVTSCQVKDLLPAIVAAFDTTRCPVTIEDISDAELDQSKADAIALVLGELAVNSDKHGALGSRGSIAIHVHCQKSTLEIVWTEIGNRLVEARTRPGGQGLKLMDRVSRSLRGSFSITWKANGLEAHMTIPLHT